ncbi:MAG: PDZ domain-containing protein [Thermoanaerobaculia bacterium]|nr:PDZ domain-containing protein [Thermoanaerobaculia bacterium]
MLAITVSRLLLASIFLVGALPAASWAQTDPDATSAPEGLTRLLRMPDIEGDTVSFVYGGDIWVVDRNGGEARRLTSDAGLEIFPKLSPDGKTVAFSAEYGGNRQLYTLPIAGGDLRQLTWYNDVGPMPPRGGWDYRVLDWTPDGQRIVFLGNRLPWGPRMTRPFTIDASGGMETPLGPPESGGGMLSPDGTQFVYTPISREYRTWKRYRGGRAQDVWVWDIGSKKAERKTSFIGTDNQPLWVADTLYFTSDRSGTLNLWSLGPGATEPTQVTFHQTWDVLWPSAGRDAIVYEAGGWIWRFEPSSGETRRIPIRAAADFGSALPQWRNVVGNLASASISPTGSRVAIEARGEIFSAPAKKGEIRNLTRTPGVRERDPAWSPDGRWIAYWSDQTGEYELWLRSADGNGSPRQITRDGAENPTWSYAVEWSPDGKRLAFADRTARLRVLEIASGEITEIDRDPFTDPTTYRWSPDSEWLVYLKTGSTRLQSLWVWNVTQGNTARLTSDETQEGDPAWGRQGRYLYFTSNRDFNLTQSDFEFDFLYTDPTRVYVAILSADGEAPLRPESDEEPAESSPPEVTATSSAAPTSVPSSVEGNSDAIPTVRIDVEGFERRILALPGGSGSYRSLEGLANGVAFLKTAEGMTSLRTYDFESRQEVTVLPDAGGYEISANGTKAVVVKGDTVSVIDLVAGQSLATDAINLDGLETRIEPRAEWAQEFVDVWRIARDWFYDPAMHGLDWLSIREKYEPLVAHVRHRGDLDYIFGELIGELNAGHSYVQSSPDASIERRDNGLLGAEITRDSTSGAFRIDHIFPGENWHADLRSPLTEPGVRVAVGDLILAVDGVSTLGVDNFYRLLENRAGQVVTLQVQSAGSSAKRLEQVRPVASETNLRYLDWVASRRQRVNDLSGGRIGYIHLPNTAIEGNREMFKGFYGQSNKDALLLDARYNGGGFIPFQMIELLQRPLLSYWAQRNSAPFPTPGFSHQGPKAVLINGYSSSGGDAFPYYFRQQGLGKLVGTRTWGGLIGISGNPDLMDGGAVLVPRFRFLNPAGEWAVENEGVAPDVEVLDRPDQVAAGEDPSLEAGVRLLLEALEAAPPLPLVIPDPPIETGAPGAIR